MTLTELFATRTDATAHALRQQSAYAGARILISSVQGGFTVTTSLPALAG
jgi:hypothetical protein